MGETSIHHHAHINTPSPSFPPSSTHGALPPEDPVAPYPVKNELTVPEPLQRFLGALFVLDDWVLLRQVETWDEQSPKGKRIKCSRPINYATQHRHAGHIAGDPVA